MAAGARVRYFAVNLMKPRIAYFRALCAGAFLLFAATGWAHSPFDCSARVILMDGTAEVTVTLGASLGEKYLALARVGAGQLPNGRPLPINPALATNFFAVTGDDVTLSPQSAEVMAGGLEYAFCFRYPLTETRALGFKALFLPALREPKAAALVLTDENANVLGTAVLTEEKATAEFALSAPSSQPSPAAGEREINGNAGETNAGASRGAMSSATAIPRTSPSFGEFLRLGVEHILTGYDHLLFLVALLLGCRCWKTMLWVVTGFTLAHSVTLALAALDVLVISSRIVEPAIAASIIFVAAENFRRGEKPWQRYALTCGFGLIHGFGFASALRETGLANGGAGLVKPLLAFNLGVETGQLCVVAVVLPLLVGLWKSLSFERFGPRIISGLVILVAAIWFWQRLG